MNNICAYGKTWKEKGMGEIKRKFKHFQRFVGF